MKNITFITGNEGKFREMSHFIPDITHADVDLPEVQSLNPLTVVEDKLDAATGKVDKPYFVEDTSLYLAGLNGFPGPLIKWLTQAVGNDGVYNLVKKINNTHATAKTIIGYVDENGKKHFFEGEVDGKIVSPIGEVGQGFGWDEIFQPDGVNETYAEMGEKWKNEFSHRALAVKKFQEHLGL